MLMLHCDHIREAERSSVQFNLKRKIRDDADLCVTMEKKIRLTSIPEAHPVLHRPTYPSSESVSAKGNASKVSPYLPETLYLDYIDRWVDTLRPSMCQGFLDNLHDNIYSPSHQILIIRITIGPILLLRWSKTNRYPILYTMFWARFALLVEMTIRWNVFTLRLCAVRVHFYLLIFHTQKKKINESNCCSHC